MPDAILRGVAPRVKVTVNFTVIAFAQLADHTAFLSFPSTEPCLFRRCLLHNYIPILYSIKTRVRMAMSPATKKVVLDGEWVQSQQGLL